MSKELIKVAATSNPSKVAGAIAGMIREGKELSVQTVGFAAMVRAVCAIGLATSFLEEDKYGVMCRIKPVEIEMSEDNLLSGYRFDLVIYTIA